ncbi:MAG: helix-turn-helix transcriptional regulator [Propionibacteriaceae bacterium]
MKNTQQLPVGVPGDLTPSSPPAPAVAVAEPAPDVDATTRQRVARSILEHGPSTATELAERLGLTAAAVRRHLDVLLERGLLAGRERRTYGVRGRGRPAKAFALTDAGRADFYSAYDQLAIDAISALAEVGGPEAVSALARRRLASVEDRFRSLRAGIGDPHDVLTSTEALAQALTGDGYVASTRPAGAVGEQLCQHHCPVAHVAEQFPQICEVETELFSRLLGVHVQRLATIAHGDGVCTTHVPALPSSRTTRAHDSRDVASSGKALI